MSKVLIMLTMTYPFGNGNEFVANEYDIINSIYDKIYVFSCADNKNNKIGYQFTDKWKMFRRNEVQNSFIKKLKYLLWGLFNINKTELQSELVRNKTLLAKIATFYYFGKYESILSFVKANLNDVKLTSTDKVVIYSYWFLQTAHCAAYIKQYLIKRIKCSAIAVSRAHGYDLYADRNAANCIPFRRHCLKHLDRVYPCSKNGELYLDKEYQDYKNKIQHSYLGTYDHGINSMEKEHIFTIVTCSNIISLKRLKLLAEALVILEKENISDLKWICVGDGNLRADLEDFCKHELTLIKTCFTGFITNTELFVLYDVQPIDVFINVSESEGLPVSIMEAQSEGIPVIATNVGGTAEIVNNNVGILLPSNPTAQNVAEAILKIKNMQKEDYMQLRKNSRNNWKESFNAKINYSNFHVNNLNVLL